MSKVWICALAAAATAFTAMPSMAQEARTTRIEPRPFYGAIVTIESGVRVFRPMPPTKHVIVNPDGATPLSLGFSETRVYERQYNSHQHSHRHTGHGYRHNYRRY